MKTKILAVMIALLSLSLFFLGCDTGTNSDSGSSAPVYPGGTTPGGGAGGGGNPQGAAAAAAALGGVAVGSTVLIPAGKDIAGTVNVPAGVTLQPQGALTISGTLNVEGDLAVNAFGLTVTGTLNASGNVTVPAAATVTLTGEMTVAGDFNLAGTLTTASTTAITVGSGGTLIIAASATSSTGGLAGTITIAAGGAMVDMEPGGGSLWDTGATGKYVYEAGASVSLVNSPDPEPVLRIGPANSGATVQLASGAKFEQAIAAYKFIGGEVTITGDYRLSYPLALEGTSLKIALSGPDKNVYLPDGGVITGDATSTITIEGSGTDNNIIKVDVNTTSGGNNFYDADIGGPSTPAAVDPSGDGTYYLITPGVYAWSANADGASGSGWQRP
jgi:cytoskeletal protein CcmA (bactofilin family)